MTEEHVYNDKEKIKPESTYYKYILFTLSDKIYGIDALRVKEIVEYGNVTRIPMVNKAICGVTNLRGLIIPVIDLSVRFGKQSKKVTRKTCNIIIEFTHGHENILLGMKIDTINSVVNFAEEDIQPAPSFGADIPMEFVKSIGTYKDEFIYLLDIDNILDIDALSELANNNKFVANYLLDVAN